MASSSARAEEKPETSPNDLSEIEAALARDVKAENDGSSTPAPPPTRAASGGGAVQSLNPDISVIGDFAFALFSEDQNHQTGGHDPTENGFNLQQLELSLSGLLLSAAIASARLVANFPGA